MGTEWCVSLWGLWRESRVSLISFMFSDIPLVIGNLTWWKNLRYDGRRTETTHRSSLHEKFPVWSSILQQRRQKWRLFHKSSLLALKEIIRANNKSLAPVLSHTVLLHNSDFFSHIALGYRKPWATRTGHTDSKPSLRSTEMTRTCFAQLLSLLLSSVLKGLP